MLIKGYGTFRSLEIEGKSVICVDYGKLRLGESGKEIREVKMREFKWGEGIEKKCRAYLTLEGVIHRREGGEGEKNNWKEENGLWKAVDTGKEYKFLEWIRRE